MFVYLKINALSILLMLINYASTYVNVIFYVKKIILMCVFVVDPGWPGLTRVDPGQPTRPVIQLFYRVNYRVGSDNYGLMCKFKDKLKIKFTCFFCIKSEVHTYSSNMHKL